MARASVNVETLSEDESDEESQRVVPRRRFRDLYLFKCEFPECTFTCRHHEGMETHVESRHNCQHCGISYFNLRLHFCPMHGQRGGHYGPPNIDQTVFQETSRSHRGTVITYTYSVPEDQVFDDIYEFFAHINIPLIKLLQENIRHFNSISVLYRQYTELEALRPMKNSDVEEINTGEKVYKYFGTNSIAIRHENFIEGAIHYIISFLIAQLALHNSNGSGYRISAIYNAIVSIGEYRPIRPRGYIPTPLELKGRRGLLNIRGDDGLCFKYCITANFYKGEIERVHTLIRKLDGKPITGPIHTKAITRIIENGRYYEDYFGRFIWPDIELPISLDEINVFEEDNNICVNVFKNNGKDLIWIRSTTIESEKCVDLLYVEDEESDNAHFILIHDRSAFEGRSGVHKHYYCTFCQQRFGAKRVMINHRKECFNITLGVMVFPKEDYYQFNKYEQSLKFPFALYYDWECFIKPETRSLPIGEGSYTRLTGSLDPSGYSYALVGPNGFLYAGVYDGPNAIDRFINLAMYMAKHVIKFIKNRNLDVQATYEEMEMHRSATQCMMCKNPFTVKDYKTLHHDHLSSRVIGSLHNSCNLRIRYKQYLPAICHNATNFDHNIICRSFHRTNVTKVNVIPKNSQKYLGFMVDGKVKFLDSCQFLPHSLAKLVANLKKSGVDKFQYTKKYFNRDDKVMDELLLSKQIYPYDYMTGEEVYSEPCLPPKEKFYDGLNDKHISDEDYEHAHRVWREFDCKKLQDYTRLYAVSDALLLADVFENFRDSAFKEMGLDPLHSWSSPGYSWSCAMYSGKYQLEYIKCPEMLDMLEEGIRGGPTFVPERIITANNENLGENCPFDPTKPRKHIMYIDLNSLYSYVMQSKLPYKDFKMLTRDEIESIDFLSLNPDNDTSYILQVDLDYPEYLHDLHDDLPLAVENRSVQLDEISPFQEKLVNLYSKVVKKPLGGNKLMMTLYPKVKYTCYLKTLQFYLKHGLILKKIHSGFSFTQGFVFRDYVTSNIEKRKATKSPIMSDLHKLLNNSIFGKTLQNAKNFHDIKFCLSRNQTLKQLAKPNLKSFLPLANDITICHLNKTKVLLNSFLYLGFTILDLAKLRLYESYYDGIKPVFGDRVRVAYGDTDSLVTLIQDPNNSFISDLAKLSNWFDFSNLDIDHPLYSSERTGVAGLWKIVIKDPVELAAVSSKMYSILTGEDIKEAREYKERVAKGEGPVKHPRVEKRELMKKGKGIGRGVLEKLKHEHYVNTIREYNKIFQVKMRGIRQYKTMLYRVEMRKIGLHALDTKRYIKMDGIKTLAFGNYRIRGIREEEKRKLDMYTNADESVTVVELTFDEPIVKRERSDESS